MRNSTIPSALESQPLLIDSQYRSTTDDGRQQRIVDSEKHHNDELDTDDPHEASSLYFHQGCVAHHHNNLSLNLSYGTSANASSPSFNSIRKRAWSFHGKAMLPTSALPNSLIPEVDIDPKQSLFQQDREESNKNKGIPELQEEGRLRLNDQDHDRNNASTVPTKRQKATATNKSTTTIRDFINYIIYAVVNVIISAPAFYGYAAIIFSHDVYQKDMNALSKLVVLSSAVHQISFVCFSSLPFAIGTVQDAGLIFLSSMSTKIATRIIDQGGSDEEVLSTALVLLSLGTSALGVVMILLGYFGLADVVSYLPMPVIGGYLAFIGYFCLLAGVGLCISENMTSISDWSYLFDPSKFLLAVPGLVAGMLLTLTSRFAPDVLPMVMGGMPILFFLVLFIFGITIDEARDSGWVGEVTPSVPAADLFRLVDFSLVRWDMINEIFPTWIGMIFVVSFASCLDVAAISMDKGEALETNKELVTIGIGNLMSGMSFGFTGSYIFSQTIFTYRSGVHSRWVGSMIVLMFGYIVVSPINVLEVSPLFFLGSTLIYIGYDLLFEWLVEVRDKIFMSEYCIVWGTFIAIQLVGMDAGILIGVLFSVIEHVVHTARTIGVNRVTKQSRAIWTPEEHKILQSQGYSKNAPRIVALEVVGSVFFGTSFFTLQRILEELGVDLSSESQDSISDKHSFSSPRSPAYFPAATDRQLLNGGIPSGNRRRPAKFAVIDLTRVSNLDASATRGCFLQLAKMAQRHGITVCACGATVQIEWMLRSHNAAYEDLEEEEAVKARYLTSDILIQASDRILLFLTIHEALQFCEHGLVHQMGRRGQLSRDVSDAFLDKLLHEERQTLSKVFGRILGSSSDEVPVLSHLDSLRYHSEIIFDAGATIFLKGTNPDGFYIVLRGAAAVAISSDDPRYKSLSSKKHIVSGAGPVQQSKSSSSLIELSVKDDDEVIVASIWPVGGIFGYVDFLLDRPRNFTAVATQEGTVVAKMTMAQIRELQNENPDLERCLQQVFLRASLLDLANCTCDE